MQQLKGFIGESLISVTKGGGSYLRMKRRREWKRARPSCKNLCKLMKEIFDKEVKKVTVSSRLISSPCSIMISLYG